MIFYAAYLISERNTGGLRGFDFTDLVPYTAILVAFLKFETNFRIVDGKVNFSINIELVSLAALITYFKNKNLTPSEATVKNSVVDSTIDAAGNIHIGDKIYNTTPKEEE